MTGQPLKTPPGEEAGSPKREILEGEKWIRRQLASELIARRSAKGWTTQQLSTASGTNDTTVSHIENERRSVSFATIAKIANALDCTVELSFVPTKL